MLAGFLVQHAFAIRDVTHQFARFELVLQIFPRSAENNQDFWRRISMPRSQNEFTGQIADGNPSAGP